MTASRTSKVGAFRAMVAAFLEAEARILGKNRTWQPTNAQQERLLAEVFATMRGEDHLFSNEIDKLVSWSADDINAFLEERGIDIRLEPLDSDTFGFAAVMKILVKWLVPGTTREIVDVHGNSYAGAHLESEYDDDADAYSVSFSSSSGHTHPIASILTTSKDIVHLTKFNEDLESFDLVARAGEILGTRRPIDGFGGVHFPMVDLDVQPDLEWMIGLWTVTDAGQRAKLVQALQQCKLQMNHKGAIVKDAFAGAISLESCRMPDPDLVIDDDFLFVLERPGAKRPAFSAVIRRDAWKDPGELDLG